MALPKEVEAYLSRGIPSAKQAYASAGGGSQMLQNGLRAAGMTTGTRTTPAAPQKRTQRPQRGGAGYRKVVLADLYSLATEGKLPKEAMAALLGQNDDSDERKGVLDVLYTLSASGQMNPQQIQALMAGG